MKITISKYLFFGALLLSFQSHADGFICSEGFPSEDSALTELTLSRDSNGICDLTLRVKTSFSDKTQTLANRIPCIVSPTNKLLVSGFKNGNTPPITATNEGFSSQLVSNTGVVMSQEQFVNGKFEESHPVEVTRTYLGIGVIGLPDGPIQFQPSDCKVVP